MKPLIHRGGQRVRLQGADEAGQPNELDDALDELSAEAFQNEYDIVQTALRTRCYASSWHRT